MLRGTGFALVSGALLLAACGDDGGLSPADDQETADEAIAAVEQALRDEGFTASPDDETQDLPFQSEACQELEKVAFLQSGQEVPGETARARSGPFDRGRDESTGRVEENVRAGVTFIAEPRDLDPFFEMLNDERLAPCLEEEMRTLFEEEADESQEALDIGDVEFDLLGGEGLGDAAGGFQGSIAIMTPGFTYRFSFAAQYVRVDRAVVAVSTVAVGNEEPTADRTALLQILVDGVSESA
jgi:hypothetical protein